MEPSVFNKKLLLPIPILALSACSQLVMSDTAKVRVNSNLQASSVTNNFQGTWEGQGYQYDIEESWTIKLVIAEGQYKIDYPSLQCGGVLTLLNATANKMEFREKITYGLCVDNGDTVITKTGPNTANFAWYDRDGSKGVDGTLRRR